VVQTVSRSIRELVAYVHSLPGCSKEEGVHVSKCHTRVLQDGRIELILGVYRWQGLKSEHLFDVTETYEPLTTF